MSIVSIYEYIYTHSFIGIIISYNQNSTLEVEEVYNEDIINFNNNKNDTGGKIPPYNLRFHLQFESFFKMLKIYSIYCTKRLLHQKKPIANTNSGRPTVVSIFDKSKIKISRARFTKNIF